MSYLLDTNVFIEAKNRYYGLDFCPAFWDWLIDGNNSGMLFSIDKVFDEIKNCSDKDELAIWANNGGKNIFCPTDVAACAKVSAWVNKQKYEQQAIYTFLEKADYFLIAHALVNNHTVVTHEVTGQQSKKKIKIPDVCSGLGLTCITPYKMLREEKALFILKNDYSEKK